MSTDAANANNLSCLKRRFTSRYVRIVDGSVRIDDHFPGGRLDANILGDGTWEIERTDFFAGRDERHVHSVIANGHGAESLGDVFDATRDVLRNGTPVVDGPATYTVASDSYACTVVAIDRKGTRVTLRRDKAKLLNGAGSGEPDALKFEPGGFCGHTSGTQRYAYEADPNGETYVVTRRVRKSGDVVWKSVGYGTSKPGLSAHFLGREEHYDFNY